MRFLLSIFLITWAASAVASDECVLRIGAHPRTMHTFGKMHIAETAPTYIWLSKEVGDVVPANPQGRSKRTFNYNTLYRLSDSHGKSWFFRFSGEWFDAAKTHRTAFWDVEWADGKYPALPGNYRVSSVYAPRPQHGKKTLATIGDSMTWFNYGQYFRCKLADKLPGYRFIGSNTDTLGFGHDGHGGDNTMEVLHRLNRVPTSDTYFLLMGSNDGAYTPPQTAQNIGIIVHRLIARGNRPHVYVSTLPVRGDELAPLATERNAAIREWYEHCGCSEDVTLIDTEKAMIETPDALAKYINPKPDLIHPSLEGYDFLSTLISTAIKREDGAPSRERLVAVNDTKDWRPTVSK